MELGNNIRQLRRERGMTQKQLAQAMEAVERSIAEEECPELTALWEETRAMA